MAGNRDGAARPARPASSGLRYLFCPVCFGGHDLLARESLNAGIGVLLAVTAVVLAGFGAFFVSLARRARAAADAPEEIGRRDGGYAEAAPGPAAAEGAVRR
jgi:hypothetical protein